MKRSPIQRSTSLHRSAPLAHGPGPRRRTPLRPINPKRLARLRKQQFGRQADLCRRLPCCICTPADVAAALADRRGVALWSAMPLQFEGEPHHARSRGAGGRDRDTVPLCRRHHDEYHDRGRKTFARKHAIDLRALAKTIAAWIERHDREAERKAA